MTPAACGAFMFTLIVHCRTSSVPVVKKLMSPSAFLIVTITFGRIDLVPNFLHSSSTSASVSKPVSRSSNETEIGMIGSPGEFVCIQLAILARCLFFCRM